MSPYPAQVDRDSIIRTARGMIESEGYEHLSLARLAGALNIKAPSLYNHFANKAELIRAVNTLTNRELAEAMRRAAQPESPLNDGKSAVLAMARAYRAFALAHPAVYKLALSPLTAEERPDPATLEQLALPLQAIIARITGEKRSLVALRGVWALVHGYVMLETDGQFQRGGNIAEAFETAIEVYVEGLTVSNTSVMR